MECSPWTEHLRGSEDYTLPSCQSSFYSHFFRPGMWNGQDQELDDWTTPMKDGSTSTRMQGECAAHLLTEHRKNLILLTGGSHSRARRSVAVVAQHRPSRIVSTSGTATSITPRMSHMFCRQSACSIDNRQGHCAGASQGAFIGQGIRVRPLPCTYSCFQWSCPTNSD